MGAPSPMFDFHPARDVDDVDREVRELVREVRREVLCTINGTEWLVQGRRQNIMQRVGVPPRDELRLGRVAT